MNSTKVRRCLDCPRMTRPSRTLVADYPGTTQRQGNLCMSCHRLTLRRTGTDPAPRPSHEYILAGLRSFLARRHEREAAMMRRTYYQEMSRA